MNDESLLSTPGELLTAARKRQGASLADVAERTKIPVAMLDAIERDEYHRISDPLYVKSFLRSAAVEVGLDPDELLDLYARATGSVRPGTSPEEVWEEQTVTIHRVGVPWGRVSAVSAAVVVGVVLVVMAGRWLGGVQKDDVAAGALPATGQVAANGDPVPPESLVTKTPATGEAIDTSRDTLAGGGPSDRVTDEAVATPESETGAAEPPPSPEPVVTAAPSVSKVTDPPVRDMPPTEAATDARELAIAVTGSAGLPLAAGQPRSQILRVLTATPVTVSVRRDGERNFTRYRLPGSGAGLPPLPEADIEPGRAYAVQGGVVAYWGARDHFDLVLDRIRDVEISLNGLVRDLSRVQPGDEMVLDAFQPPRPR